MDTDVAVVGGGPVGLTAALFLGRLGIRVVLIERNATTSAHPRGHVLNGRTMEILRSVGLEEAVRAVGLPDERNRGVAFAESLAGGDIGVLETRGLPDRDAAYAAASATQKVSCPQDAFEPALLRAVEAEPNVTLLFGTELNAVDPREREVRLHCATGGNERNISARYVVAADGARSFLRSSLGVGMSGPGRIGRQIGIYFEADLWPHISGRPYLLWWIFNALTCGVLISLDGRHRWTYNFAFDADTDSVESFTPQRCEEVIRAALGDQTVPVMIRSVLPWRMQARLADRFQAGHDRIFLAGDAAHPLPPTGGQGMNTGIGDAHNLAWKLALVLRGRAPDSLLRSYEVERRPVAALNIDQSVRNALKMADSGLSGMATHDSPVARMIAEGRLSEARDHIEKVIPSLREHFDYLGQTFGYRYASDWITPDGSTPPAFQVETYEPCASPGHRAPHVWLAGPNGMVSTHDMIRPGHMTLFNASNGQVWAEAFRAQLAEKAIAGCAFTIGNGRDGEYRSDGSFERLYQIGDSGMVLIRPDGHVAARSVRLSDGSEGFLRQSLERVLNGSQVERRHGRSNSKVA